jgi:hypothetical protein
MSYRIKPIVYSNTPYERKMNEIARAMAAQTKAVQDYNIMMGILDDPSEDEEEDEMEV